MHNDLKITEPLPVKADYFFGRPFLVIHLHGDFAGAITKQITHAQIKRLAKAGLIGSIDQISDNTDILSDPEWRTVLRKLYD